MDPERLGIVGRAEEQHQMRGVLASVRDGMSGTLILRGEAGIGKTSLLDEVAASAHDLDVLRIVGIESEISLGFAALHQLLRPLLGQVATLPEPQADALRAAFGMGGNVGADQFLVGLATLTLLASAATKRGLVLIVDDAQWLDPESERVLAFVARRLHADSIGVFVAVRVPADRELALDGLPALELGGLERRASVELIRSVVPDPVDADVRGRVLADAQGNPLAIVEFTRELMQHAEPGAASLPQPLPLNRRLEARFLRQVRELSPPTQSLLLAAASDPTGDAALLWRAGSALDFGENAAKEAEAADLISFGPPIVFRHPLIREAIYHGASDSERRRTHAALADATGIGVDPDRRAWHRAAAALVPDEGVAAELEAAAARARRQGGYASTAALLTRAAQLTPDPTRRGLRLLDAAASDLTAGQPLRAEAALELSKPMLRDPYVSAQARRLEGAIQMALGRSAGEAPKLVLEAATAMYPFDPREARETLLDALHMAMWFGNCAEAGVREVMLAAKAMALPSGEPPTSSDLILDALAEYFISGPRAAAPLLRRALAAVSVDPLAREVPRRMAFGVWTAFALGDNEALARLANEYVVIARENGALNHLPEALQYLGLVELRAGTLARADSYFTEEGELQQIRSMYRFGSVGQMLVLAWRGDEAGARASAATASAVAREFKSGWTAFRVDVALAVLELGLGNYRAAANASFEGWKDEIALNAFTAADVIEAHARSGRPDRAGEYVAALDECAAATDAPLELGLAARSRALLSDDADAERHYQDAVTRLTENGSGLHLARAQLVYGEWLRRQKRRRDAREQLAAALGTFSEVGAGAFAERARVELLATGASARKRIDETRSDLTPQETQIATLAASGATNPEIAAQLFISASTVEYHLRKVYRKLDVSSRRMLGPALLGN